MIRLKNRAYPVWISWEGKEEDFEMAKVSIIQDIINSGFSHYDAYVDVVEDAGKDKEWDGTEREIPTVDELKPQGSETSQPVNPPTKPTYETRGKVVEEPTPTKSGGSASNTKQKTASK